MSNRNHKKFEIIDWAGNRMDIEAMQRHYKTPTMLVGSNLFDSFDDAWEFLDHVFQGLSDEEREIEAQDYTVVEA